jgi:hypothetical protein
MWDYGCAGDQGRGFVAAFLDILVDFDNAFYA